jgi:hypothetical protein
MVAARSLMAMASCSPGLAALAWPLAQARHKVVQAMKVFMAAAFQ